MYPEQGEVRGQDNPKRDHEAVRYYISDAHGMLAFILPGVWDCSGLHGYSPSH
jgi:hypothetical protein